MFTSLAPLLFCLMGAWLQDNPVTNRGYDSRSAVISTDVELVILDVSVKDVKGRFISGLAAENFRIYQDKKPQQIKYFSRSEIPVTIGLVIDNCGSMRAERPTVITAALVLLETSNPRDEMFIISRKDTMRSVQESRATIYTIGIFDENDPDSNSDVLRQLAQVSGGEYFRLRETPEIMTVCQKIATDIRSRYTIAYVFSHLGSSRSVHLVKVTASAPSGEKLIVHTRTRYMMPERNQQTLSLKETGP